MEPRKFASRGAANFLRRFPLSDLDGSGMRSATPWMPLASFVSEGDVRSPGLATRSSSAFCRRTVLDGQ